MFRTLLSLLHGAISSLKTRQGLVLEVVALRHQLSVLRRGCPKRPKLNRCDRLLWVWLSKVWSAWSQSLVIVQPETVIRWHRSAFKLYWRWKSGRGKPGRPKITAALRALIR